MTESPLEASGGRHFIGMIRDITWRKQAEEHQARLVEVLEATPDFVGLADAQLNPIFLNQSGRMMVGLGTEEEIAEPRSATTSLNRRRRSSQTKAFRRCWSGAPGLGKPF